MKCWECKRIVQVPDPTDVVPQTRMFIARVTCNCGATYKVTTERGDDRVRKVRLEDDDGA